MTVPPPVVDTLKQWGFTLQGHQAGVPHSDCTKEQSYRDTLAQWCSEVDTETFRRRSTALLPWVKTLNPRDEKNPVEVATGYGY